MNYSKCEDNTWEKLSLKTHFLFPTESSSPLTETQHVQKTQQLLLQMKRNKFLSQRWTSDKSSWQVFRNHELEVIWLYL